VLLFSFNHGELNCIQNADNDLWEANRMVTSGVATRKGVDLDFEDESQSAVHVMVHNLKPPFLDGRTVFTKQLDPINPIRDLTSDMAAFAKKGSALVKEKREQAERAKAAAKLAALGGTALGNILGVKDEETEVEGASPLICPLLVLKLTKLCMVRAFTHSSSRGRRKRCYKRILQRGFQVREPFENFCGRKLLREEPDPPRAARVFACICMSRGFAKVHPR
jgi:hypothetical protein